MIDPDRIRRILIRGANWIGDAILTTPAIEAIRKGFPRARISLLSIPSVAPVFENNPHVDEILRYERKGRHRGVGGRIRLILELRDGQYDLAILLQNAIDAAILAAGAGIPMRYGYNTDGRGFLLRPAVPLPAETLGKHQVHYYLDLLRPLLGDRVPREEDIPSPAIHLTEAERRRVAESSARLGIRSNDLVIGIHAGATYGTAKRWSPDRFAGAARLLMERHGAKIVIFGGPGEEEVAREVAAKACRRSVIARSEATKQSLQEENPPHLYNLAGQTSLRELMAWISRCRLLLTNDSGPMHIAAALGVPVAAIFGSTNPATTAPFGPGHVLIRKETSCAPCLLRECPTDHQCMDAVGVEDVMDAVERVVRPSTSSGRTAGGPAVFLDRDGTLIEEVGYLNSLDRFRLLPGAASAVARLNRAGLKVFLVTNQSGVGRGYFSIDFVHATHRHLQDLLAREGARLDGILVCPHGPEEGCRCRKPRTRMMTHAALEHGIDPESSFVVGDKPVDVEMARNGGGTGVLVLTGYGAELLREGAFPKPPDYVAKNLPEAADWILAEIRRRENRAIPSVPLDDRSFHPERILVVKPSSLGDILHALPVLQGIRRRWPKAWITWVVKGQWADLLRGHPGIDELIHLKEGSLTSGLRAFRKRLRQGGYGLVLDLQGLFRSGFIARLSGAPVRIGFRNAREGASLFYTHSMEIPRTLHAVERNLRLAEGFSLMEPADRGRVPFPLSVGREVWREISDFLTENRLADHRPWVALFPGARWEKKRWPAPSFAKLCALLNRDLQAGIILLGGRREAGLIRRIREEAGVPVTTVTDLSLRGVAALLSRVDLAVTNDSGPMHLAAAVGTPAAALFGPTDPGRTGPYGEGHAVIRKELDCSPCFRKPCIHDRFLCMETIAVEEVFEKARELLNSGRA